METISTIRLNTLKVEFGERCAKPTDHELIEFAIMLELLPEDIHTLYQDTNDDCIYLKFHDGDKLKEVLAKHKKVTFLYNNGSSTEVVLCEAQGTSRYVRVFNVPPEIEDEDIREVFEQYGNVLSVEREKYTDTFGFSVFNGVRGVCIELKKLMPSVVSVKNFRAKVFHRGLNDKCVICNSTDHDEHNCKGLRNPSRRLRRLHSEFALRMVDNENLVPTKLVTKKRQPVVRSKTFSEKSPPLVLERIDSLENGEVSVVKQETPVPVKKDPKKVENLMVKLKQLSVNRGATGINSLGVAFRCMDTDGNRKLDFEEFKQGLMNTGMNLFDDEARLIFDEFDTDNSGSINVTEFLVALKGSMPESRKKIVLQAFKKLDTSGDGVITYDDLKNIYDVKNHPKFVSGKETKQEIIERFLANFEDNATMDGKVTQEEFLKYYTGISASIDSDLFFDLMIRQAYKL